MTNHATAGKDSCFFSETPAIRVAQYMLHTHLICINNFRHNLNNFISILYLYVFLHSNDYHYKLICKAFYFTSWIWHSEDRASPYILIMEANEMHYFSNLFDKVLSMFRTFPLPIIRSISTLYTRNRYLSF
jgi:hypothetical protein